MQRDFICAYFGGDQSGITWTITARGFASVKQAEKHGLFMMPTAGVFGFAVIAEDEDSWTLHTDYSMLPDNVSVGPDDLNGYNVTNAPQLEMVA
jgi:hypothetical protein